MSIQGFGLIEAALETVRRSRLLLGDPDALRVLDPAKGEPKSYRLSESGLTANHALAQKHTASRCAAWIRRRNVAVRCVRRPMHLQGSAYLIERDGQQDGVLGSSSFTRRGLDRAADGRMMLNVALSDSRRTADLTSWFDALWDDNSRTRRAKPDLLRILTGIGQDHSPELIYFKTLYSLFKDQLDAYEAREAQVRDAHLYDTKIWNTLYQFQKDAAHSIIGRLERQDGCILADSVGLGKTYTALAVIKYFELRNRQVLVLCPRRLRDNWALYPVHAADRNNPFLKDRFAYTLLSHTDLSRTKGQANGVDLARLQWDNFDLLVIDESHNSRNDGGQRYARLLEDVLRQGSRTKLLMLSATPVNTSLMDLRNQIHLMTQGKEDAFRKSLGIRNTTKLFHQAQTQFESWVTRKRSSRRSKRELISHLGADFLRLLDAVSIARSRRHVKRTYAVDMESIGRFPEHRPPENLHPPTDLDGELSYLKLAGSISRFGLAIYRPSHYVVDPIRQLELRRKGHGGNFNQRDRERFLIGMIRTNFLKRLESSAHSLTLTLDRTIAKMSDMLGKIARYRRLVGAHGRGSPMESLDLAPLDDDDDEDFFVNRARHRTPYRLSELDVGRWERDIRRDRQLLAGVRGQVAAVTPMRDGKLHALRDLVAHRGENPTCDRDGRVHRKMLIFTTFTDTAEYLYEELEPDVCGRGMTLAMVSGTVTRSEQGDIGFQEVLSRFAPRGRSATLAKPEKEIDILIATDCVSEGQNLQDCDVVVNYDVHWNPVRIVQRFGRIDRIGSRHDAVRMINYWPTAEMDAYLGLKDRVNARMVLADMAASGDADPLTPKQVGGELTFRDEQVLRLRDEIPDLDDLDDGPNLTDFTLDQFLAQLQIYLRRERHRLVRVPEGAYAVVSSDSSVGPGVLFLLRHRGRKESGMASLASPIHPFYLVLLDDGGSIRVGCGRPREILDVFARLSLGKCTPLRRLCEAFDRDVEGGRKMDAMDRLLRTAVSHIEQQYVRQSLRRLRRGGRGVVLPRASQRQISLGAFDLVSWLLIRRARESEAP